MAKLNERQARLLEAVKETYGQVKPSLEKLEFDYQSAEYRAKTPVRDAINAAVEAGVPYRRIAQEAMGFGYPQKLQLWLSAPDSLVQALMGGAVPVTEFDSTVEEVKAVTREPTTGEFTVNYMEKTYKVPSYGPMNDCWTPADPSIPQGVYDVIQREFPQWTLLEDEEEDDE